MSNKLEINDLVRVLSDVKQITNQLSNFSPFKVLGLTDHEIRHSFVLAWLLNPVENHGFGNRFLKDFLQEVLIASENQEKLNQNRNLQIVVLEDLKDVSVRREHQNIDILIDSAHSKFVCLIENKVHSKEHSNQLNRYLEIVESEYEGYSILPIFLTLDGQIPSNEKYYVATYSNVIAVLQKLVVEFDEKLIPNIATFVKQYIEILEEKTMTDENLREIARKIYLENKAAIDLIHTVGNSIDLSISGEKLFERNPEFAPVWKNSNWYTFIDKRFEIQKKFNIDWGKGNPVQLWFSPYNGKLKLCLEVGPFPDGHKRLEFLLSLESKGLPIRGSSKVSTGTYTRLWTSTEKIKDWTDSDELLQKMEKLLNTTDLRKQIDMVAELIEEFEYFKI